MEATKLTRRLRKRLIKHRGKYPEIAKRSRRLSISWLNKFALGDRDNPTKDMLDDLEYALDKYEAYLDTIAA